MGDGPRAAPRCITVPCKALGYAEILEALMDARDGGTMLRCTESRAPITLTIAEIGPLPYQLACVRCGRHSGWFDRREGVVRIVATPPHSRIPPGQRRR